MLKKGVEKIRKSHPRLGGRKLFHMLKQEPEYRDVLLGRDAFFTFLANENMLIRRKKRRNVTTDSNHCFYTYRNLIRGLTVCQTNQVWVSDITYWRWKDRFLYLTFITDAFSRLILGYSISTHLEAINNVHSLQMAIGNAAGNLKGLIHHSDRGIQYCCHEYIDLLKLNSIHISMSENGDPLENALAERINGIIKSEYLEHYQINTFYQAQQIMDRAIRLYNQERPHMSCSMMTPYQVYHQPNRVLK